MIIVLHILAALTSIAVTTLAYLAPSVRKLQLSTGLVALTLISGTYLVVSSHTRILETCLIGLVYTAGVVYGIVAAQQKLAAELIRSNKR